MIRINTSHFTHHFTPPLHCTFTPSPISNPKFPNKPNLQIIKSIEKAKTFLLSIYNIGTTYSHTTITTSCEAFSVVQLKVKARKQKPSHVFSSLEFHCYVCSTSTSSAWHCAPFTLSYQDHSLTGPTPSSVSAVFRLCKC